VDDFIALPRQQLARVKVLCSQAGLNVVDLAEHFLGVGVAVPLGPADYVVLSVMGGGIENHLMITSGILKDIQRDRLAALNACNHFTSSNTAYPVYLHDAEIGWALIMQQTHPIEVLLDIPEYFSAVVRHMPRLAAEYRLTVAEKWSIGGLPWAWNEQDLGALLIRSMM
jgi:hypothetical protein